MASQLDYKKNPYACSVEEPEVAFELILPGAKAPRLFGESFAYPCVPLIGVYTDESYDPCLPIALVGVPLIDESAQLPPDVLLLLGRARRQGLVRDGLTELYFIIHSGLQGDKPCCQRWCTNRDEFNVMLHAWTLCDDGIADSAGALEARLITGLFHTQGVRPVHLDSYPAEGGMPFDSVAYMRVCMHDRRFSPCNANVRLVKPAPPVVSFFSLAIDQATFRAVVTYHVLPIGDPPADTIRGWMRGRETLSALVAGVEEHLAGDPARFLRAMLGPLGRFEAAPVGGPAAGGGVEAAALAPVAAVPGSLGESDKVAPSGGGAAAAAPPDVLASSSASGGGASSAACSPVSLAPSAELPADDGMETE